MAECGVCSRHCDIPEGGGVSAEDGCGTSVIYAYRYSSGVHWKMDARHESQEAGAC